MKELSIEEKAKRYDEALHKAKNYYSTTDSSSDIKLIGLIFPELKESEDEKMRKSIIYALRNGGFYDNDKTDEAIAWLEKQATPQVRTGLEWVNTIDDACDKRYAEEYAHGEYCHEQSFKWGFQEGVDWLEKQCGQNHVNTSKFHEGDWITIKE